MTVCGLFPPSSHHQHDLITSFITIFSVPVRTAVIADPVKVLFALVDVARVWFCAAVIHLLARRE